MTGKTKQLHLPEGTSASTLTEVPEAGACAAKLDQSISRAVGGETVHGTTLTRRTMHKTIAATTLATLPRPAMASVGHTAALPLTTVISNLLEAERAVRDHEEKMEELEERIAEHCRQSRIFDVELPGVPESKPFSFYKESSDLMEYYITRKLAGLIEHYMPAAEKLLSLDPAAVDKVEMYLEGKRRAMRARLNDTKQAFDCLPEADEWKQASALRTTLWDAEAEAWTALLSFPVANTVEHEEKLEAVWSYKDREGCEWNQKEMAALLSATVQRN